LLIPEEDAVFSSRLLPNYQYKLGPELDWLG